MQVMRQTMNPLTPKILAETPIWTIGFDSIYLPEYRNHQISVTIIVETARRVV